MEFWLRVLGSCALFVGASSCILLSGSSEDVQCESDADCEGLSETPHVCDAEAKVCVVPDSTGATTGASASSSTGGTGGGEQTGCVSNAQCIDDNGQLPYLCQAPGEDCVPLLSEHCTEFFGDIEGLRDDDPILLGLVTRYTGDTEENLLSSQILRNAVLLGIEEIDNVARGLPVGDNNTRRRFYAVSCNEAEDVDAALSHLTETLDVPIIMGVEDPEKALDTALGLAIPEGRLMLQLVGESNDWATLDDNGLVWVASYFGDSMSRVLARVYTDSEPEIVEFLEKPALRVAEIARNDIGGLQLAGAFEQEVLINGISAGQAAKTGTFSRFLYEPEPDDLSGLALDIAEFLPDVIVVFGVSTENGDLITVIESAWPEAERRPYWFFDYQGYDYPVEFAMEDLMAEGEQTIADRVLGVRPYLPPDRSNYDEFGIRYRSRFDNQSPGTLAGPLPYDATYQLAYAIVGAGTAPVLTGNVIAEGFADLVPPGATIDVGPTSINDAISALKANTSIDFQGAVSDYDWNLGEGTARQYQSTYCYAPAGEANVTSIVTGISWNPTTDEITGDLGPCRKWVARR